MNQYLNPSPDTDWLNVPQLQMTPLKKAVMHLAARELGEGGRHLAGIQSMFNAIDRDGNGMIDAAEIAESLQRSGDSSTSVDDIKELIKQMDVNGTGFIQQETFMAATLNRSLLERKDLLESAFRKFDLDGDGVIGYEDYAKLLLELQILSAQETADDLQTSAADLALMKNKLLDFDHFVSLVFQDEVTDQKQPSCFGSGCIIM